MTVSKLIKMLSMLEGDLVVTSNGQDILDIVLTKEGKIDIKTIKEITREEAGAMLAFGKQITNLLTNRK